MTGFLDLALTYDATRRCCDLVLDDDFNLVPDETPVTPILLSVGVDRRASPDDDLPDGRSQFLTPVSFSERRGALLDGLNVAGDMAGCKMWLLERAKETETTRQLAEYYLAEGLAWAETDTGTPAEIEVWWLRAGVLAYRVLVEDVALELTRKVA
ncbi:phage GP46 family protein [Agrobacterium leguminum]|uniref:phage GP46 family protein n=1 Tax=Agrobacterium leguminum TaxID=2792015 RepID=UPI003CE48C38